MRIHIPPVLPADFKQRVRNLAKRAVSHRFHQFGEEVAVGHGDLLELLEPRRGLLGVALVQQVQHINLVLLFLLRGPNLLPNYL